MLGVHLMLEVSRRYQSSGVPRSIRPLLEDACLQAKYCLDAPDEVQDGAEWFADPETDTFGVIPRVIDVRARGEAK